MKEITKSKLKLKNNPTAADFQQYVRDLVKERGFKNTNSESFMLLLEECGEMAKAARKLERGMSLDKNSKIFELGHEVADVFIYLLDICNRYGVDLEKAFREKEAINKQRVWRFVR